MSIFNNFLTKHQIENIKNYHDSDDLGTLANYIEDFSLEAKAELLLLFWKGKGEIIEDNLSSLNQAKEIVKDDNFAGEIVCEPLGDYLRKLEL